MTEAEERIITMLKIDLQISSDAVDSFLLGKIHAAEEYISTEGITLDYANSGDVDLVEMYAAYLYRERRNTGDTSKMPRSLRWALNNRLFHEKAAIS